MLKANAIDNSSWEKSKYNDPYELKDDEVSNPEDANLFSSFNLPQMCLSSVIDMYKSKPNADTIESPNIPEDLKDHIKNKEKFSTAKKLFEKSSEDATSEDYFNFEPPVPATRNHIYKNGASSNAQLKQLSPHRSHPQTSIYKDEGGPDDLSGFHTNHHPAHCHEEDLYYEQPWDLSNTQGSLEGHLQHFLNKALPANVKSNSKDALSSSHIGDCRTHGNYEKPWDLRPEKKDERGAEGYDQAWDLKPHNKDERPCGDYDLPWDKNARQIERKFRASQRDKGSCIAKNNGKLGAVAENNSKKNEVKVGHNNEAKIIDKKSKNAPEGLNEYMNVEVRGKHGKARMSKEVPLKEEGRSGVDARVMSTSCLGIDSSLQDNYYNVQNIAKRGSADDDSVSCKSRSLVSLTTETPPSNYANQQVINKIRHKHTAHQPNNPVKKDDKKVEKIAEKKCDEKSDKKADRKSDKRDKKCDKRSDKKGNKEGKVSHHEEAKRKSSKPAPFSTFRIPSPPPQPPQMVRSCRQDDPRSEEEYDVPWDQKIKNLLARAKVEVNMKAGGEVAKSNVAVRKSIHLPPPPPPSSIPPPFDVKAPLESQCWYHGLISRTQAEDILRTHKEGSYLVRTSESNHSDYSLSVKSSKGFMHMKIVASKGTSNATQYILGQFSQPFNSIPQMIYHYSHSKLPIKGAEHISLLYPIAQEFL